MNHTPMHQCNLVDNVYSFLFLALSAKYIAMVDIV